MDRQSAVVVQIERVSVGLGPFRYGGSDVAVAAA